MFNLFDIRKLVSIVLTFRFEIHTFFGSQRLDFSLEKSLVLLGVGVGVGLENTSLTTSPPSPPNKVLQTVVLKGLGEFIFSLSTYC
jgi:hypothetical protein